MASLHNLGGTFTLKGSTQPLHRIGYGAMRLTGPMIWGEPRDRKEALAVLREAISLGVNHIDTSDFYGPHVANLLIKEALHPYPKELTIVTKVGAKRAPDKSWPKALSEEDLTTAVHDNLRNLGVDALDVVNLRVGEAATTNEVSIAEPLSVLLRLKEQGLIRHLGLSNISLAQFNEAEAMTEIVCVQNQYNVAHRHDDALIDWLAGKDIAYVPFFPLGGFQPLQSARLDEIATSLSATPMQVALAWLLQRSPNILLIPGTSSVSHLRENIAAGELTLSTDTVDQLEGLLNQGVTRHE